MTVTFGRVFLAYDLFLTSYYGNFQTGAKVQKESISAAPQRPEDPAR